MWIHSILNLLCEYQALLYHLGDKTYLPTEFSSLTQQSFCLARWSDLDQSFPWVPLPVSAVTFSCFKFGLKSPLGEFFLFFKLYDTNVINELVYWKNETNLNKILSKCLQFIDQTYFSDGETRLIEFWMKKKRHDSFCRVFYQNWNPEVS